MNHLMRCGLAAVALSGLVALGGCSETSNGRITPSSVRANMSPEMEAIGETHQQRLNRYARVTDTNLRQIPDDWDTIWLMDKPMQMSRYPIPGR